MTDARRRLIHSRRCWSACSQVLVHRIVSARRVVAVAASFLVAACADRTRGASVPGTGSGTEFGRAERSSPAVVPSGAIMVLMADPLTASGVTRKEAEVLAGLGEQLTNAEIAARMYVSERTVETHVSSLLRKLHASNRRELGRLAGRAGADVDGRQRHDRPVRNGHLPVHRRRGLDGVVGAVPIVHAGGAGPPRRRRCADAITRHRGHIFTATGDGFGAAFASAPEAVAAAVDAQRSLALESWPGDVAVRVRMGLHSGTATERNGNYFGGAVNRAARITAIGRGGQILLSAATADLVADEGWTMVDLGRHRLKGLERPERIVRLDAPGLPVVDALTACRPRSRRQPAAPVHRVDRPSRTS